MPPRSASKVAFCLAIALAASSGFGQIPGFQVPDGRRHFIVLFDTSASMWGTATKRRSLEHACTALSLALYEGGGELGAIPRFRTGKDLVSIVQFGFDRSRDHSHAYERLRGATLGDDYVRPVVRMSPNISQAAFLRTFDIPQSQKTNINALAWALPLGLSSARVGPQSAIQRTYVILVNDAQLNDGSMALERYTLGLWLGDRGHATLERAEAEQTKNVRLLNDQGAPLPLVSKPFGQDRNMVTVSAFQAQSVPSLAKAASLAALRPLEGADTAWVNGRLHVSFKVPNELRGKKATLTVAKVDKPPSASLTLDLSTSADLDLSADFADQTVKLVLRPEVAASNDLLGTQVFTIPFEEPVRLPSSAESSASRRNRNLVWLVLAGLAGWGGLTLYRRGWLTSDMGLRLPGYASAFELPPLSQMRTSRFVVRVPTGTDEWALSVLPPVGWVRRILYRHARVAWDGQLASMAPGTAQDSVDLTDLSGGVNLKWVNRTPDATEARVVIERKLPLFPAHRLEIVVRFAALPRLSPKDRILSKDLTS